MRRRLRVWGVVLVLTATGAALAPARADDFVLGSGNGIATSVRAGPQTGGLTIAVTFGQALADFQGRVGRASARAIDFGILETALTAPGCGGKASSLKQSDFPQGLDADSRDPASVNGKVEQEGGSEPGSPLFGTIGRKEVQANPAPYSRAVTTTAAFGIDGLLSVGAGRAEVTTRIIKDEVREVVGSVDISSLDLLGGAIQLAGLRWEAVHRTGKETVSEGVFSVASMAINGAKVPLPPGGAEAALLLAPVNAVLLGTGLQIDPPRLDTAAAAADLTPLRIRIDRSPLGQALVAPIVTAAGIVAMHTSSEGTDGRAMGVALREIQTRVQERLRWRWALVQAVEASADRQPEVQVRLADFLRGQFGVQTLASFGWLRGGALEGDGDETGVFALHTLGDDE